MPGASGAPAARTSPGEGERRATSSSVAAWASSPTTATCSGPARDASAAARVQPAKRGSRPASAPAAAIAASARSRCSAQPAVDDVGVDDEAGAAGGGLEQGRVVQQGPGLGHGRDGQAVPRGDDLVV